ncbi:hypothetical protein MCANUFG4_00998 [Mycoplasmopsis canis UFG4]|uniref:HTH HARE-type domain-containing protein n=2 Tax=Mycoplasmopsis canis TaxID=29555 RepID=I1A6P7_9BACT|nr:hypothetical protein [Mycoplasmopsis canis]AKF41197.1 hypothetical protein AAW50_02040 [Mycoplasmopsis canis]AMD81310.1 hypothetical protein AXW82_01960 [Mycoplasmopsis canis PG 14]EIE40406.1 hypothetical protein MCANUF31_00993 [Mycoplasmopsis canis UF31]EIE40547.1 hypothetical protein MCANPG14_01023 [Mycoplasmopsis canis PG 14]EIE40690.1 hypothetical protein MCANUF33_01018 [Mycoplasmopsis canis UF33]
MKNTTMLEVASEFILNEPNRSFTFDEIFQKVENELKDIWVKRFLIPGEDESYEKIREKRMGELYRLLTVDKKFFRNEDGTWSSKYKN